ncbi:GspE/PulE family protein [Pectobacterium carotovorum]|uniref:GspE/PulE family protein n=1 Tax=Pectobacterium carotovorum TaxID=554 RepID=UPI00068F248B|nr:ATPase, T2SS/T4P/T4SS family [Pectobacterium carotovorum]SHH69250.1 Type II secretory pathway ATPase GspE/PulE or T4P pilus assembly pathway ATPase PilB [Pectobacterium carotovorum]
MINSSFSLSKNNDLLRISDAYKGKIFILRSDGKDTLCVEKTIYDSAVLLDCEKTLKENNVDYDLKSLTIAEMDYLNKRFNRADENESREESINLSLDIFKDAASKNASDVHLDVKENLCNIEYRIDGKLRFQREIPAEAGKRRARTIFNWISVEQSEGTFIPNAVCESRVLPSYVDQFGLSGGRLSSRPTKDGFHMVIRLFKTRPPVSNFSDLGLLPEQVAAIKRAIAKPAGAIFFTGPMGSGKSTLAQIICEDVKRSDPGIHIATVESPIEYPMDGITQTPLLPGEAWGDALSSILRQDVNMFLFGEINNSASANGVIEAAETGHYVITSLHTPEAIQTLIRLRGLGVPLDLLTNPSLIVAMVGQRLAPLLCEHCKVPYQQAKDNPELIKYPLDQHKIELIEKHCDAHNVFLTSNSGCSECDDQGVKGRTGVFEVIETDRKMLRIYEKEDEFSAYQYFLKKGGISLCSSTKRLINSGYLDPILANKDICNLNRDDMYS